ncbi:GTPBP1 family GTP-binding protein [Halorutilales archaeon Cl-col2-1]
MELARLVEDGERENIEFKERLERQTHLESGRLESLAAQMKHRILTGGGSATYVVGVTDDGGLEGISDEELDESISVLSVIAGEADAALREVETHDVGTGEVAVVSITNAYEDKDHLVVGTAGHVDHGKSTLVGSLVTGTPDDGDGSTRVYLDVQPHEMDRGLSADLSYGVYGFESGSEEPVRMNNPLSKRERSSVVENSEKLVSFVDTVGHEPWLKTTIRGIMGQKLDYGLVTVAADDGPTHITREHLGILLAADLPTIVAVTKSDLVSDDRIEEVEDEVAELLKNVGKIPHSVEDRGVETAVDRLPRGVIVPIVRTSAVSMEGLDTLDEIFRELPKTHGEIESDEKFEMYIDRTYEVTGVGTVASGTVKQGEVEVGDEVYLGPTSDGDFRRAEVRSIEMHYHRVEKAKPGNIVGVALKGKEVDEVEISRGMALTSDPDAESVREFEAEVMVLNHPTRIREGYEPVVHLETVSEAAVFEPEGGHLLPGQEGKAKLRFKFRPYMVKEGQRFVFREGKSKGVGTVTEVGTGEDED